MAQGRGGGGGNASRVQHLLRPNRCVSLTHTPVLPCPLFLPLAQPSLSPSRLRVPPRDTPPQLGELVCAKREKRPLGIIPSPIAPFFPTLFCPEALKRVLGGEASGDKPGKVLRGSETQEVCNAMKGTKRSQVAKAPGAPGAAAVPLRLVVRNGQRSLSAQRLVHSEMVKVTVGVSAEGKRITCDNCALKGQHWPWLQGQTFDELVGTCSTMMTKSLQLVKEPHISEAERQFHMAAARRAREAQRMFLQRALGAASAAAAVAKAAMAAAARVEGDHLDSVANEEVGEMPWNRNVRRLNSPTHATV